MLVWTIDVGGQKYPDQSKHRQKSSKNEPKLFAAANLYIKELYCCYNIVTLH